MRPFEPADFALLAIDDQLTHPDDKSAYEELKRSCRSVAFRMLHRKGYSRWGDVNQAADDLVGDLVVSLRLAELNARKSIDVADATSGALLSYAQRALASIQMHRAEGLEEWPALTSSAACEAQPGAKRIPTAVLLVILRELRVRILYRDPNAAAQQIAPWSVPSMAALIDESKARVRWYVLRALLTHCTDAFRQLGTVQLESFDDPQPGAEDIEQYESSADIAPGAHWLSPEGRQSGSLALSLRGVIIRMVCTRMIERLEAEHATGRVEDMTCLCLRTLFMAFAEVLEDPETKPYTHARLRLVRELGLTESEARAGLAAAQRHPMYHRFLAAIRDEL